MAPGAHGRSSSNACGHCEATKTTRPFPKRHTAATAACSCSQQRPNAGGSGLTRGHAVLGLRPPHGLQGTAPANSSPRGCGLAQPRIFSLTWRRQILFENQWTNEQINVDGKTQSYAKSWPENYSTQTPAQAGAELTTSDHGHSARSSAQVLSLSRMPSPWALIGPRTRRPQRLLSPPRPAPTGVWHRHTAHCASTPVDGRATFPSGDFLPGCSYPKTGRPSIDASSGGTTQRGTVRKCPSSLGPTPSGEARAGPHPDHIAFCFVPQGGVQAPHNLTPFPNWFPSCVRALRAQTTSTRCPLCPGHGDVHLVKDANE